MSHDVVLLGLEQLHKLTVGKVELSLLLQQLIRERCVLAYQTECIRSCLTTASRSSTVVCNNTHTAAISELQSQKDTVDSNAVERNRSQS